MKLRRPIGAALFSVAALLTTYDLVTPGGVRSANAFVIAFGISAVGCVMLYGLRRGVFLIAAVVIAIAIYAYIDYLAAALRGTHVTPDATHGERVVTASICLLIGLLVVLMPERIMALGRATRHFFRQRGIAAIVVAFIASYLSMILAFAITFASIYLSAGAHAFHCPAPPSFWDFVYFSAVTATTLGYGDITPVSNAAKILAVTEALISV